MVVCSRSLLDSQRWSLHRARQSDRVCWLDGVKIVKIVKMSSYLLFFLQLLGFSSCHVSLTFPPARNLALDFLDNIRTKAPCGMPKGESKTSLLAGTSLNITWHLGYPHRGESVVTYRVSTNTLATLFFALYRPSKHIG